MTVGNHFGFFILKLCNFLYDFIPLQIGGASIKILVVAPISKSKNPKITAKRKPQRNEKSLNLLKSKVKRTSDLS